MNYSPSPEFDKIKQYCDFQERCQSEVRVKLMSMNVYGDVLEEMIANLIEENYIDETRYACSYARGKYRHNDWGKLKIKQGLSIKDISSYDIRKALEQIDEQDYLDKIEYLIGRKIKNVNDLQEYQYRQKIFNYMLSKGYEATYITLILDKIID